METIECDDRGRLLLAKGIREEYGEKFILVRALREIVLLPVPKNPLKALREEGKKLPKNLSVADLKKIARQSALKEVLEEAEERQTLGKRIKK